MNQLNSMEKNNQNIQFKTNINCSGCVANVKPYLDKVVGAEEWSVDTLNKDKVLTINSSKISKEEVISTIQKAGYKIEYLN